MRQARAGPGGRAPAEARDFVSSRQLDGPEHSAQSLPRPVGSIAVAISADVVFRRKVAALHRKGPRVLLELLAELGAEWSLMVPIEMLLDQYLGLDDRALDLLDARDLPPPPLHVVRR